MIRPQPPRDRLSTIAGLSAAALLSAGLAYVVFGPSASSGGSRPWKLIWVSIVSPTPVKARPHGQ